MSNDRIDSNMEDLVQEAAEEVAVNAQEYSEEIEKTIANTDGDPCNRWGMDRGALLSRMRAAKLVLWAVVGDIRQFY